MEIGSTTAFPYDHGNIIAAGPFLADGDNSANIFSSSIDGYNGTSDFNSAQSFNGNLKKWG